MSRLGEIASRYEKSYLLDCYFSV